MSHYDEAVDRLTYKPNGTAIERALVHAVLAVCDAIRETGAAPETEVADAQPHRGADAHWSVLQRERDAARARARDLQRELDDARVAVTHMRRELDDACRVRDEWQTRSRELRNERDALRAAISRAARLLVDRVDPANTVAASSPSAHPYVKLGPEDK